MVRVPACAHHRGMPVLTFDGARYRVQEGETALDALLRGGANVSFSCRRGSCQVCLLRTRGAVGDETRRGLREAMRAKGYFLPCVTRPTHDLDLEHADLSELFVRALVAEKRTLSSSVVELSLETEVAMSWRAGQYVNVRKSGGAVRSYSIASIAEEDYYLKIQVERVADGEVSRWLCDELAEGAELELRGPIGSMFYDAEMQGRPLLLVGSGTGLAPLSGLARDALRQGHTGDVFLYHGASDHQGLYLRSELADLQRSHPRFHYVPCVSREAAEIGGAAGRANEVAFSRHADATGWLVFLAGSPEVVHDARARAVAAGVRRADVHADPFEPSRPYQPNDSAKIAGIEPEPELWAALGQGPGLKALLEQFYAEVFADPRLAPFFHAVTKQRAIEKQYEFLAALFSGDQKYFGLDPFNAHHWMVISDELFDYREALMERVMRRRGLAEHLVRRWSRIHELFRRELVKATPRGLILAGVEQPAEGYTEETALIATVCDGCAAEVLEGARGRMHVRTGKFFCTHCSARKVGETLAPPP